MTVHTVAALLFLLALSTLAHTSKPPVFALGVDFGTEQMRAVLYAAHSPLQFAIVEDDAGAATVPTALAFAPKTNRRLLGDDAVVRAARAPAQVVRDPKRLLGFAADSPALDSYARLFPAISLAPAHKSGSPPVVFKLDNGARHVFPDEAIASLASYLASATDANVLMRPVGGLHGAKPRAVLVAPSYFSNARRAALKQAFELGGIHVLDVVDELGAAAIDFGAMHLPSVGPARTNIVVVGAGAVGVGAALAEVSVAADGVISVRVLAAEHDGSVGGADVDNLLVEMVLEGDDAADAILANPAATMRLREAVRATKEVCLKTSPSCVVRVKQLIEKSDFEREIATADVEKRVRELSERMVAPLARLLADAKSHGVDVADIGGVELFGGASRFTPFQNAAASVVQRFGLKVGHRLNTELSAAQGAARLAAGIVNPSGARRVNYESRAVAASVSAGELAQPLASDGVELKAIRAHLAAAAELDRALLQRSEARATLEKYLIAAGEALDKMEEAGVDVDAGRASVRAQRDFLDMEADELTTVEQFTERLDSAVEALTPLLRASGVTDDDDDRQSIDSSKVRGSKKAKVEKEAFSDKEMEDEMKKRKRVRNAASKKILKERSKKAGKKDEL